MSIRHRGLLSSGESTDPLPTTLAELKQTKGGFVPFHFPTGKDKDAIAKDLAAAFKLSEPPPASASPPGCSN